ncbi:MAG: type II toxin-antitoxin system RelE/ParE family toxin [Oscillospiraceae bacterium]|nr:type II toxin-antitoxin system RelE/ParE family toxin [Oscillospiraceae bacterium]
MPKHSIIVSKKASAMLDRHVEFLARVSPKAADRLRVKVMNEIRGIEANPEGFPLWCPHFNLRKPFRRIIVEKRYMILFTVHDKKVVVAYIIDTRMNNEEII